MYMLASQKKKLREDAGEMLKEVQLSLLSFALEKETIQ